MFESGSKRRTITIGLNLMHYTFCIWVMMMMIVVVLANTIDFDQIYRMLEIDSRTKEKILAFGERVNQKTAVFKMVQ